MDIEALERLGRLRSSGAIGEDEFESEKRRLLQSTAKDDPHPAEMGSDEPALYDDYEPIQGVDRKPFGRVALIIVAALAIAGVGSFTAYRYGLIKITSLKGSSPTAKYSLRSKVKGVHIGALDQLPKNPNDADGSCSPYEKAAVSPDAKLATSVGWHVTAEQTVGGLNAISFVGTCTAVSETSFKAIDGNIGLFADGQLKAVVYGKKVARLSGGNDADHIEIKSGSSEDVVAQIAVADHSVVITD